jgi:2-phosphosulfolactate phosphatase
VTSWLGQDSGSVRFDWGPAGARQLAAASACLVVADVLSFSTAATIATGAGTRVFPSSWSDGRAAELAIRTDAVLAAGRLAATAQSPWSLSPAALLRAPFTPRLVLPSPNGSAIAAAAAGGHRTVVAGCLRNATAVAGWLADQGFATPDRPLAVIAAGERWPDGSMRPALEDLLGAGAIISALRSLGAGQLSAEAAAAAACFGATPDIEGAVASCVSGRELIAGGFAGDIAIAAELDSCTVVPVLSGGAFSAAAGRSAAE